MECASRPLERLDFSKLERKLKCWQRKKMQNISNYCFCNDIWSQTILDSGTSKSLRSPQFGLDFLSLTPLTLSLCLTTWSLTLISHFNALTAAGDMTDGPRSQVLNTTLLEDRCNICAAVERLKCKQIDFARKSHYIRGYQIRV